MQTQEQNKDEQGPVFYRPKTLSLFSTLTNIWAWLNLIVAILYLVFEVFSLDNQIMQMGAAGLLTTGGHWWEWKNLTSDLVLRNVFPVVIAVVSLAGNFFLFKGISIGLNVLLELGFTMTSDEEEADNE